VAEFTALLAEVRRRGFATAVDEFEAGLTAIAAPALAAAVRRAADEISRRLGWPAR